MCGKDREEGREVVPVCERDDAPLAPLINVNGKAAVIRFIFFPVYCFCWKDSEITCGLAVPFRLIKPPSPSWGEMP